MTQYTLVSTAEGERFITAFIPGEGAFAANADHPNFETIVAKAAADEDLTAELFDVGRAVAERFRHLSDRVTVRGGTVYLDGDPVDNALTQQVVRFLDEGVEDWKPLVAFFENVQANPEPHSRESLYRWLAARDFTITDDGNIIGYKGVRRSPAEQGTEGGYQSINQGYAIVNGEEHHEGPVPNEPGAVVEMPRSQVEHNPAQGCSVGLHVGTFTYARSFGQVVLEVEVNPRDVVSVPTDHGDAKMRVCRYHVIDRIDNPHERAVRPAEANPDAHDSDLARADW